MKKHFWVAGAIFLVGFLNYAGSLNHGFILDDHAFFNELLENIKFLPLQFLPDHNRFLGVEGLHNDVYYRPMALVIPMLCHLTFGGIMWAYHLFNLILFCTAAFLIYFFIVKIQLIESSNKKNETLAILTALLYVVHPIHGVVVNFITASVFSAQVIFMLSALLVLCRGSIHRTQGRDKIFPIALFRGGTFSTRPYGYVPSIFFFVLALMCHETAMALPFYLFVLVWVKEGSFRRAGKVSLPFFILIFCYFIWRLYAASLNDTIFRNINDHWFTGLEYAAGFSKLVFWYLGQLICPVGIVLSWATPISPVHEVLWILGLAGLVVAGGFLCWYYRRDKPILLGLAWLAIGFGPVTFAAVFQPMNGFMIEPHWLIFPSIGFFMGVASIILRLSSRRTWTYALVLILLWGQLSQMYNKLWGNEKSYCRYWLSQAPGLRPIKYFLGFAYMIDGQYTQARRYYIECISHMYVDYLFYANLAFMDLKEGKLDGAQYYYGQSLRIEPRLQSALCNLGLIAVEKDDLKKAEYYFQRAREANRFALAPKINLGHLLVLESRLDEAKVVYQEILDLAPHQPIALLALERIYQAQGNKTMAVQAAAELIRYGRDENSLAESGLVLARAGMYAPATKVFERIVAMDPNSKQAREILNRLYQQVN